jgi:hypothetical protein
VAGPPAGLSDTTSPVLTFTAPGVPSGGATLTFQLTVSDGVHTSTPDTVDITIRNVNQAPVADAGGDQTVREGSLVTLHAGDSFDPDSDALTYQWTQIAGAPVSLSDPAVAQPTFTAPTVGSGGDTLRFVVTVGDGTAASTDEVAIVVTNLNQTPIANAGSDQTVDAGTAVTLSAAASTDPDGDALIYSWTQVSGPLVALSGADSALARFTAPAAGPNGGTLVFQLTVGDGSSVGEPDTVTVTVRDANQPPSCDRAVASPKRLWPPNHRFTPVRITGIADPNDRRVRVTITSVTQSEPVSGHGDCGTSPDALVHGKHLLLRAERDGHGTGRIYDVTFKATDAKGAACTGTVSVCVPHDRRGACIDTGKRYNSLSR